MRRLALAFVASACLAFPAAAQTVGGAYTVEGKNFDGSPYRRHRDDQSSRTT